MAGPMQYLSHDEAGFGEAPQNFDTPLSSSEETSFQQWKSKYAPQDSGADYDLRGAYKAGRQPDAETGHWPDTFKKPNHPTFSVESKYAAYGNPGKWTGPKHDKFVAGVGNYLSHEDAGYSSPDAIDESVRDSQSPGQIAKSAAKDIAGYSAGALSQIEDMLVSTANIFSLPGSWATSTLALAKGESLDTAAKAAMNYRESFLPAWLQAPFGKIAEAMGKEEKSYYDENGIGWVMKHFGEGVEKGSQAIGERTGIPPEYLQLVAGQAMDLLGAKGVKTGVKDAAGRYEAAGKDRVMAVQRAATPEQEVTVRPGEVGDLAAAEDTKTLREQLDDRLNIKDPATEARAHSERLKEIKAAFKDNPTEAKELRALADRRMEQSAWQLVQDAEKNGRVDPEAKLPVDWTEVNDIVQKPGWQRTPEEQIRLRQYARGIGANAPKGSIDPDLLAILGGVGGAALTGKLLYEYFKEKPETEQERRERLPPDDILTPEELRDNEQKQHIIPDGSNAPDVAGLGLGAAALVGAVKGKLPLEALKEGVKAPEGGSVDPQLLKRMAAVAAGAAVGSQLSDDHPVMAAIAGGIAGGASARFSPKGAAASIKVAFAPDTRIRINDLADAHDTGIARAARVIWQQQRALIDSAPKTEDRVAITNAVQQGRVGSLPPALQKAASQAKDFFSKMADEGQKSGVLKGLVDNYVTNLWDLTGKNKGIWEDILAKAGGPSMSPESRFALKRKITSLEEGKKLGLVPRTEDVAEIMGIYGNSLARSMENKKMLTSLREATVPGGEQKLVMPSQKAPPSYVVIDHPQMTGVRVHPDIAPSMKFIFDNSDPGVVARGLEGLNTAIKRTAVSFSLFHAKALADANVGAYGMLKGIPRTVKDLAQAAAPSLFGTNTFLKQLRKGGVGDLVDKAQEGGLKFSFEKGKLADEDVGGSFYSGLKLAQQGLDAALFKGAGKPVEAVAKINHLVDTFMWERLHAGMKLSVFADKLEVLRNADAKAAAREGREPKSEKELSAQAASFTNDIFGGLNWRRLAEEAHTKWGRGISTAAYSPKGRRVMQLLMFAPDWTISTTRAAARTAGQFLGYEKGSGVRGLWEPQNATDLHRQYMLRSAMYYALVGDGINYALSGHHLWDNKDWTRLDMGDGRTMQWSKHSMEPIHWLTQPGQQALNKLGFIPKEIANQALGTEYLTSKGGGPRMDTSLVGRGEHVLKSMAPIAAQQAFGGQAASGGGISGFMGAPIYGKTYAERAALKEERRMKRLRDRVQQQYGVKR